MPLLLALFLFLTAPAQAMVGGVPAAQPGEGVGHVVLIVGTDGLYCSGTVVAPGRVLTAAHCVPAARAPKLVVFRGGQPQLVDIERIITHPGFDARMFENRRATPDLAVVHVAADRLAGLSPVALTGPRPTPKPGERMLVAGYGVTVPDDPRSGGVLRATELVVTGQPSTFQVRLVDAATRGDTAGRGACRGDSGGPVFVRENDRLTLIAVMNWSTGPANAREPRCGGITGTVPIAPYRAWIDTALRG